MMSAVLKPGIIFAPMREEDIDAVTEIEQSAQAFPWTRGNFADSLKAGHGMWVCHHGNALLGHAVLMMAVDEAHLLNITVLPERQRRGLGGELLGYLFDVARSHGAVRMLLEVRPGNDAALALYRRFGFGEVGRRRGYYQGSEDAIVMAREL